MNEQIEDILKLALEDNLRIREIGHEIWDRAFEAGRASKPDGLRKVKARQVRDKIQGFISLDCVWFDRFSVYLADWFNDPDRDAPVEPTKPTDIKGSTQMLQNGNMRIRGEVVPAEARIISALGLDKLPDYETWFEVHGDEGTVKRHRTHPLHEATVHELYTMFRARLLDELRQAGVLGGE